MDKATAEQQSLFEAALGGSGCTFKISGKGNLNVIGGDRDAVTEAATEARHFVVHLPSADCNGSIVGYDAKGFDFTGFDRDGYDAKGFNGMGRNKDGLTVAAVRAAKKATPPVLTSAPEVLRETANAKITKEGRRLYFALPYGHRMASVVKENGGTWEAATKRWWIGAAGNLNLVEVFDQLVEQELIHAVQNAEHKAAQEQAAAEALAALVWIRIPFEATDVRKKAKAKGATWDPLTKRWSLAPEAAEAVKASLTKWQATQEAAKAAERAAAPINLYTFIYRGSHAWQTHVGWEAGQTTWSESEDAFVTLVTVKRTWRSGEEDDGGEDEAGYSYTATGRLATEEEVNALRAQYKEGR